MRWLTVITLCVAAQLSGQASGPTTAEFPFAYRDGFIRVELSVQGHAERLSLLFDTGSSVSVLSLSAVERLGLSTGRRVRVQGVQNELTGYWPTRISAKLDELEFSTDVLAVDLSKLSDACHQDVDGLIGADFLRGRIVQIDFEAHRIRLLAPEALALDGEVLPLRVGRTGIGVPIRVNGGDPRWVRLDTGCASSLHWVESRGTSRSGSAVAMVALADAEAPRDLASIQLGALGFADVAVIVHGKGIFPGECGLLGNGLLSRFSSVTIDTRSNRLILRPSRPTP